MRAVQGALYALSRALRQMSPYWHRLVRFAAHRPFLALFLITFTSLLLLIQLFHKLTYGGMGRWYYNYALLKTPDALVRFIPKGGWDEPREPPRWVEEIYESKWMGEWDVPALSRPVWRVEKEEVQEKKVSKLPVVPDDIGEVANGLQGDAGDGHELAEMAEQDRLADVGDLPAKKIAVNPGSGLSQSERNARAWARRRMTTRQKSHDSLPTSHPHTLSRRLTSPAIIKFHVFSTSTSESSYTKRQLIRRLSPIYQIPPEYRHLIDVKFVIGYNYLDTWGPPLNETMESKIREEEREFGDIMRIPGMWRGENLRDGKIVEWIRDVGQGKDGRDAWYLFKVDDDAIINFPKLLDLLLSLDINQPTYLGTSLARWPDYHNHFTGFLTGFNYGILKTLSQGISKMKTVDVQAAWDDDVLTGELMYSLPPAPHCQTDQTGICDPHAIPPYGWMPHPPNPDPRTNLNRYDFERRAGDPAWPFTIGDLGMHGWWFKFPEFWEKEWRRTCEGRMWVPPAWLEQYADSR